MGPINRSVKVPLGKAKIALAGSRLSLQQWVSRMEKVFGRVDMRWKKAPVTATSIHTVISICDSYADKHWKQCIESIDSSKYFYFEKCYW